MVEDMKLAYLTKKMKNMVPGPEKDKVFPGRYEESLHPLIGKF